MTSGGVPTPFMGSGIKQDLHLLCNKFSAVESNKIRDFADVFRESRFETILHYRLSPAEYLEFTEYLFQNAALYFGKENEVGASRTFKERIFGIYVCYALYNMQPIDHICQIPVTQLQFKELLVFQKFLANEKALEPLTALKNLLLKKAFRFKVFQSTYDPATHKKYLAEEEMPFYSRKPIEPFARVEKIQNHQTIGELMYIHKVYTKAKRNLGLNDVQMVDKVNPVEEIQKSLEKHQKELKTARAKAVEVHSSDTLEDSAGMSRSALRSKAYASGLKHTRQRRHLDPNMEENFKHLTFGQIAQECLEENASQEPGPSNRPVKQRRKRRVINAETVEELDDNAIAEQVLREEYAARVKPELSDTNDEPNLGGKIGKQGTAGIAKIRAPKRKNAKLVEVKTERMDDDTEPITASQIDASFKSPAKKKSAVQIDVKPRISDEWANKLHAWHGQVEATDKQLKKLTSRIKLEMIDEDE